ncbi:hypothetical protein N4R57_19040 [Rhodobacteraceae bacterium D3-12]|nr:hypothetical protein N4R57_19040 [Rhodobacteraceae bacterium D3-12]
MTLTLLHTSPAHCPTFTALRDRIAPGAELTQVVREDFLARAQAGIDAALEAEITQTIQAVDGPVLCTCTTIGDVARKAGAVRIDQPMMQQAARAGGPILMVYCLQSTWEPSLALLEEALEQQGTPQKVHPLFLGDYWPLFDAGEGEAFAAVLAAAIREAVKTMPDLACVVLAQASMAGAAPLLADLSVPVLASPELALRAGLAL